MFDENPEAPESTTGGSLLKNCSWKSRKIHKKTPVPESLFY